MLYFHFCHFSEMISANQESLDNFNNEDQDALVPNEIPPATQPDLFRDIPRQADYEAPPLNQYYIQQSYDDRINSTIYEEGGHCFAMSRVRRMFCLLSLFDSLMTFLMWVIYLQVCFLFCLFITMLKKLLRAQ